MTCHVSGYGGFSNVSSVHFSLGNHLSYEQELLYLIGTGFSHSKLLQFCVIDLPTVFRDWILFDLHYSGRKGHISFHRLKIFYYGEFQTCTK